MANVGVFDVLGPVMIGPSSSHTAGAARLGKIVKTIVGNEIKEVTFLLHGSFSKTYKGHGTDRALVAGIMGMNPDNPDLRISLELAKEKGLKIDFVPTDLGDVHPNTVKFLVKDVTGLDWVVLGSSIGGGLVEINEINGNKVQITGEYSTVITCHDDIPGTVAKISGIFYNEKMNIACMKLVRSQKGQGATMSMEIDGNISSAIAEQIKKVDGVRRVIVINQEEREV